MESIIEDYRGHEIRFNTENETFVCDIDDRKSVKKSYASLKKFIDDFIKENYEFKPFKVVKVPGSYYEGKVLNIVGIRKDGRFISESKDGKKYQISDYDLEKYMLINSENEIKWGELKEVQSEIKLLQEKETEIEKSFKVTTLKSVKQNYIIE